ncbi:MAG TPA: hypothetical protein VG455_04845 [Acidimicrobiales bacterium]|nr:hypothetical protein [Acidimicrobiales bacterium]
MGIWVVILEAVQGPDDGPDEIGAEDLDAFAEELADYYPVVAGSPTSYEAELWVEDNTAGGAMLTAQRLWQAAVREAGLPMWDVLRGEARDARALESGRLAWGSAPGDDIEPTEPAPEAAPEPEPQPRPAPKARKKAATKKAPPRKATAEAPARKAAKRAVKKGAAKKKGVRRPR